MRFLCPFGAELKDPISSTGCAALHPWLHPRAPSGRRRLRRVAGFVGDGGAGGRGCPPSGIQRTLDATPLPLWGRIERPDLFHGLRCASPVATSPRPFGAKKQEARDLSQGLRCAPLQALASCSRLAGGLGALTLASRSLHQWRAPRVRCAHTPWLQPAAPLGRRRLPSRVALQPIAPREGLFLPLAAADNPGSGAIGRGRARQFRPQRGRGM